MAGFSWYQAIVPKQSKAIRMSKKLANLEALANAITQALKTNPEAVGSLGLNYLSLIFLDCEIMRMKRESPLGVKLQAMYDTANFGGYAVHRGKKYHSHRIIEIAARVKLSLTYNCPA